MEASTILWKQWQEQVKDLLPSIHGHQKKTLALSVLGIVLSKSAVLQRMAESIYVHGISQAKMVSIERRFARFVANERLDVRSIWTELLKLCRDRKFHYLLRVCKEHTCRRQLGQGWRPWTALGHLILKEGQQWFGRVLLWQDQQTIETQLSAVWDTGHQEAWFLISDLPAGRKRVCEYARRMRVESTFQDGKSRGWNLEASLIEDLTRLNRLLLALFLAMWWVSHLAASCIHHGKREQFDRHDRRDKSIFRLGQLWLLDILRRATNPAALTWCLPFQRTGTTWKFDL